MQDERSKVPGYVVIEGEGAGAAKSSSSMEV